MIELPLFSPAPSAKSSAFPRYFAFYAHCRVGQFLQALQFTFNQFLQHLNSFHFFTAADSIALSANSQRHRGLQHNARTGHNDNRSRRIPLYTSTHPHQLPIMSDAGAVTIRTRKFVGYYVSLWPGRKLGWGWNGRWMYACMRGRRRREDRLENIGRATGDAWQTSRVDREDSSNAHQLPYSCSQRCSFPRLSWLLCGLGNHRDKPASKLEYKKLEAVRGAQDIRDIKEHPEEIGKIPFTIAILENAVHAA